MTGAVRLRSDDLEVVLTPAKGADLTSLVDRRTGVDVLFRTPWAGASSSTDAASLPPLGSSKADWLARYAGGWQVLLPNAGEERVQAGAPQGFHGEAAVRAWTVEEAGNDAAVLTVDLLTAPLRVRRTVRVTGPRLELTETVTNLAPDPVPFRWVHHPAFGAPFVDRHTRIRAGARSLVTDAQAPGTVLDADRLLPFPVCRGRDGGEVDLSRAPDPAVPREVFAALTDFDEHWFAVESPTHGFGVRVSWDGAVLPHAWFWQECHATAAYPWFRRAYVVAVEPANVLPGAGTVAGLTRGADAVLEGSGRRTLRLTLERFPLT